MRKGRNFYKNILDNLYNGVYLADRNREIIYWNREAERLTGYSSAEVMGRRCWDNVLMHVDERGTSLCTKGCPLSETLDDGRTREGEAYLQHKDGYRVPVLIRVAPIRDPDGQVIGAVEIFSDNSSKVAALQRIEELQRIALVDPLTEVGNRRYSELHLQERIQELERYGWPSGVIFSDIDRFKLINDAFGHSVGDEVLKMVARTILKSIRSFDYIGRWGGEEFIAIIVNVNEEQLRWIAEKFRSLVEHSHLSIGPDVIRVTISLGATLLRPDDSVESVVKRADALMYHSKSLGRNLVSVG